MKRPKNTPRIWWYVWIPLREYVWYPIKRWWYHEVKPEHFDQPDKTCYEYGCTDDCPVSEDFRNKLARRGVEPICLQKVTQARPPARNQ